MLAYAGTASPQAPPRSPVVPGTTIQQGLDGRVVSRGPGRWLKLPGQVHSQGAPPWPVAQPETCEDTRLRVKAFYNLNSHAGTSWAWGGSSVISITEEAEAGGCKFKVSLGYRVT